MIKYIFLTFIALATINVELFAQCQGDCDNGYGTYIYANGSKYVGYFKAKKAHGMGTLYYSDGKKYVGEWKDHKFEGEGTYTTTDGKIFQGIWKENKLVMAKDLSATKSPSSLDGAAPIKPSKTDLAEENMDYISKDNKNAALIQPKTYAVVVGVARYLHMQSLNYTDDDAYKMYAFLRSPEGGAVEDDNIAVLVDEGATKEKIIENLTSMFAKAGQEDMVLFYFSGHGEKDGLLPIDFNGYDNVLLHQELNGIMEKSKAKYKICITDACYSGKMEEAVSFKDNAAGTEEETNRIKKYYRSSFDAFSNSSIALMLSSKAEETSVENSGLRQGIFTHFLLRALQDGEADLNNDKFVTLDEAFNFVKKNVNYYTSKYQTPVLVGNIQNLVLSELRN